MLKERQIGRRHNEQYLLGTAFRHVKNVLAVLAVVFLSAGSAVAQYYNPYQNNNRQTAFREEIARLDISVERAGEVPLPINMVPRVRGGDIIRVKMLDQPVNGISPDESRWDWTFVVAFINPSRNETGEEAVSREINFRRDGWYREHAFKVPYDSQPIFFLYPRPNYRNKIRKFLNKNFDDVRKIGEKTLELAGAYAQIGSFLNQLQDVINQDRYGPDIYGGYGGYGGYYDYGYGNTDRGDFMKEQFVERLAKSFKIGLPDCWKGGNNAGYNYNTNYDSSYNNNYNSNDFTSRAQCVAQNVKLEDFDLSVSRILQQGGILASTKLVRKYPELAHWISVAAVAVDLILKITKKTPLKILPTMAYAGNSAQNSYNRNNYYQNNYYQNNRSTYSNNQQNNPNAAANRTTQTSSAGYNKNQSTIIPPQPISIFADKPPTDSNYVSAFPIVLHKWQAQPDPEVISLPVPKLLEPCLHMGVNVLKNTDLSYDWLSDPFTREFRLVMSSANGFTKEFPLTKNMGMNGWDLMLGPNDIEAFPKVKMTLESEVIATRGFSKIKSGKFEIPIPGGGNWTITDESLKQFAVGGKRRVVINNTDGDCICLQSVKYKPSFGGEFDFAVGADANPLRISEDGSYAWFDIDTAEFKADTGNIEVFAFGSVKPQVIPVNLYPPPPGITKLSVHKGDRRIMIEGSRTEQILSLRVNGKLAGFDKGSNNPGQSSRVFVFQSPEDMILGKDVVIEMELEGGRQYKYPESFPVLAARPAIAVNEKGEIKADALGGTTRKSQFDLSPYPVAPVDTERMTAAVRTTLTDYDFRAENISIETRIENGGVGEKELPAATFEVIDTFNMRIDFTFDSQYQQFLAGRRLQFRIRDRERGDSVWYTIGQTFIRIPEITSVSCQSGRCRVVGQGLDYVGKYSTDGGKTWKPPLQAEAMANGRFFLIIPEVKDKRLLQIKLRDFEDTEGWRPF